MPADVGPSTADARLAAGGVFDHVLVGIDETPESLVAAAQAGVLRAPGGRLALLAVVERHLAAHAGLAAADAEDRLLAGTSDDLERARELVDADDAILTFGRLVDRLCAECDSRRATLVAVGVRPHGRVAALTFGGHDVEALRRTRCSLLVARPGWGPHLPDRIVVGVDGTPASRVAEGVARELAERLGRDVVPVVGLDGHVDLTVLRAERDDALIVPGRLADAVVDASTRSSLVVVGRPEPGTRHDLGGRIVHSARCSVLLVRNGR